MSRLSAIGVAVPWMLLAALACSGAAERKPATARGSEAKPGARDGYVEASDGTRLYYRQMGEGLRAVVVPVGFYLEDALAPLASDGRRLIFYDPRGRGRSDAVDTTRVSLDRQVSDLEDLRRSLGIERMALIGWSGLGMEMVVYALRHPDRVTRIVQVAPVPPRNTPYNERAYAERERRIDPEAERAFRAREEAGEFEGDPAAECRAEQAVTLPVNFADPSNASKVPDVCVYPNERSDNLGPLFRALLGSFGDYDWRNELHGLHVPRLVLHGAADAFPVEGSQEWVRGYPEARLMVVPGAGHFVFLERPDVFFPAVRSFLGGDWPEDARSLPAVAPEG